MLLLIDMLLEKTQNEVGIIIFHKIMQQKSLKPRSICSGEMAATLYHNIMFSKDCEGQWAVWKWFWWAGTCKIYKVQATKVILSCPIIR